MADRKKPPHNISPRIIRGLVICCLGLAAMDFIIHRHAYFTVEALPLFFVITGAGAMAVIIAISLLARPFLVRAKDYYDRPYMTAQSKTKSGGDHA